MDSPYDAEEIQARIRQLGHVFLGDNYIADGGRNVFVSRSGAAVLSGSDGAVTAEMRLASLDAFQLRCETMLVG